MRTPGDLGIVASLNGSSSSQKTQLALNSAHSQMPPTMPRPAPPASFQFSTSKASPVSSSAAPSFSPLPTSPSSFVGALPPLQVSSSQLAQLQMQNYYLQQMLLLQQNNLLRCGTAVPPLVGVSNPLTCHGTNQTSQTSQTSIPPPGFAVPLLPHSAAVQSATPTVAGDVLNETSQTVNAVAMESGPLDSTCQTSQTGLASESAAVQNRESEQLNGSPCAQKSGHTHQVTNSAHPVVCSEVATPPSISEATTGGGVSVSRPESSQDYDSSSSEGETRQLSHQSGDSCLADSESEPVARRFVAGESQLIFAGGTQRPNSAGERALIKR